VDGAKSPGRTSRLGIEELKKALAAHLAS